MTWGSGWSPGTVKLLRGEAARLGELARMFDDLDAELRLLLPEGWAGAAHDAYVDARGRLAKQLRSVADAHELASQALDDYADTLEELGERRRYETASDGLARLELQRVDAARQAEEACRKAAEELAAVKPVLPELAKATAVPERVPAAGGPPLLPLPVPAGKATHEREPADPHDPHLGDSDRVAYRTNLQDLCDAVLDHLSAP
ncbi:putative T7SS-secreted protein [Amycolatopsis sp. cmx-8-4]|uniref:putative T7SS-secreted protein n=1 Tax=Amycolatopsis sp. cmx-8-4 TaxID=2790947 RepID=UPI003979626B